MKKFSRKNFLKGLALGTISLPFMIKGCGPENLAQSSHQSGPNIITGKKYQWKMVTTWPPKFPVLGEGCELFADWVYEMSGGRLEIKVFGGGELVPALEVFDAVKSGVADMGSGVAYYWAGKIPAAQFFASVPFGMNAQQLNAWIMNGGGLQLWEELYEPYGLIPMLGGNTGVQMGGWFNREINSIEDFKGLKMRMPGLGGKVLERAGGSVVLMAGSELYTGLEKGIIDATEWIGPYHDYKMGFHQIADYYYSPGWHETGTALELLVNKSKMEELPKDLQAIVRVAAAKLNIWTLSEFEAKNGLYLGKLINEEKVKVKRFPSDVLNTLREYTATITREYASEDPFSRKVYEAYEKFRKEIGLWSDLSEKVYYDDIQM